jgi:hypothetical protein
MVDTFLEFTVNCLLWVELEKVRPDMCFSLIL